VDCGGGDWEVPAGEADAEEPLVGAGALLGAGGCVVLLVGGDPAWGAACDDGDAWPGLPEVAVCCCCAA
jgi:hypothetical protein